MRARLHLAVVATIAAAIYLAGLKNGWVTDDWHVVVGNEWIRTPAGFTRPFWDEMWAFMGQEPSNYYRPLMHVAYTAVYLPFGPSPLAYHALNLLAHVAASALVFILARRILRNDWSAFAGALLFAVHPAHVEAVAWVSALPDIACGVFVALSLWAFLEDRHALGAGAYLVALLFKESAALLPLIVLAVDVARRASAGAAYWTARYGPLFAAAVIYAGLRLHAIGGVTASAPVSPIRVLALAGTVAWEYLCVLVAPVELTIAHATPPAGWLWWAPLVGLAAALGTAIARRSAAWTLATGTLFLTMVPALAGPGLLRWETSWAERYAYVPSIGLAIAAGLLADRLAASRPRWIPAACAAGAVVCAVCVVVVLHRTSYWRDDFTLWNDAVSENPDSGVAHSFLGYAWLSRGDTDRAMTELVRAVALLPSDPSAHLNLGVVLAMKGDHRAAIDQYVTVLETRPRDATARADLAISLSTLGFQAEARHEAEEALRLRPGLAKAHLALGMALGNAGDVRPAAGEFRRAVELDPTDLLAQENLARALGKVQDR